MAKTWAPEDEALVRWQQRITPINATDMGTMALQLEAMREHVRIACPSMLPTTDYLSVMLLKTTQRLDELEAKA